MLHPEECNRKTLAQRLGVGEHQLRAWEASGKLQPEKRGRVTVYSPALQRTTAALVQALRAGRTADQSRDPNKSD